jgi:hypothetical protein
MSPNNPRLPFELQESILSHLAGCLDSESYRPVLASCALVCDAWHSIVQPWIFTELEIRSDLTEIDNIAKFFGTSSPSHHLSKHVKRVTVAAFLSSVLPLSVMLRAMDEREMFQLFNNVEHIDIALVHDSFSKEGITLLSQFRQLRKMQLMLTTTRVASFHHLVSSFPALTHLGLGLCDAYFSDSGLAHVRALKLQRLGIFLLAGSPAFPSGMRLDAPGLEYLTLKWGDYLRDWDAVFFVRSVMASIPLENIKTLNLIGHTRDAADVHSGKSWRPST